MPRSYAGLAHKLLPLQWRLPAPHAVAIAIAWQLLVARHSHSLSTFSLLGSRLHGDQCEGEGGRESEGSGQWREDGVGVGVWNWAEVLLIGGRGRERREKDDGGVLKRGRERGFEFG